MPELTRFCHPMTSTRFEGPISLTIQRKCFGPVNMNTVKCNCVGPAFADRLRCRTPIFGKRCETSIGKHKRHGIYLCKAEEGSESNTRTSTSDTSTASPSASTDQQDEGPSQLNKWIAGGAVAIGAVLVVLSRASPGQVSLTTLQKQSTSLDTALQNGKPTLMEFYANWCEVCNDMTADVANLKSTYEGRLNFVMLNIDNSRWLPEMAEYRVSGVPHFVFLDAEGKPQAATIGRLPKEVLDINTKALVNGERLPFKRKVGEVSTGGAATPQKSMPGPRSHA